MNGSQVLAGLPAVVRHRVTRWVSGILGLAAVGYGVFVVCSPAEPHIGDCLASLEAGWTGYDLVDCDRPDAAYRIVSRAVDPADIDCGKYDQDAWLVGSGHGHDSADWTMCAVAA